MALQDDDLDPEDLDEDEDDEEAGEPEQPPQLHVFTDWNELCSGVREEIATHYRYARFTGVRLRPCEKGRFFPLDAPEEDASLFPRPRSGEYRVILYRQVSGAEGRPTMQEVNFDPGNPSLKLAVSFKGEIPKVPAPVPPAPAPPPDFTQIHLSAYKDRLTEAKELHQSLKEFREEGWARAEELQEELDKANKKIKRLRKKLRKAKGGVMGLVKAALKDKEALKEIASEVVRPGLGAVLRTVSAPRPGPAE